MESVFNIIFALVFAIALAFFAAVIGLAWWFFRLVTVIGTCVEAILAAVKAINNHPTTQHARLSPPDHLPESAVSSHRVVRVDPTDPAAP